MTIQTRLIDELTSRDAASRRRAAYILGTVDETAALDRLYEQYAVEQHDDARNAILWAGKRLKAIQTTGYTTVEALIAHYRLQTPFSEQPDRAEQQVIDNYKLHTHMNTLDARKRGAAASTAMNVLLLPPIFSAGRFLSGSLTGADMGATLDAMEHSSSEPLLRAMIPPRPGSENITPVIQRLRAAADPAQRIDIVLDLAQLYNNPDALPDLSAAFVRDNDERVRETAQRAAKLIYWNALYWDMKADGSIDRVLVQSDVRHSDASPTLSHPPADAPLAASAEDIAEILRKAEEARERRRRSK